MAVTLPDRLRVDLSDKEIFDVAASIIAFIGLVFYIVRYLLIRGGRATLWGDVTCCWKPLGNALANGVPLYLTEVTTDNKPPLWEFIAALGGVTGDVGLILLLVDGIGALALLWITYKYSQKILEDRVLALLAQLVVFSIIAAIAFMSNNKLPGAALIYAALYVRRPLIAGVLASASVLIVQYSLLAVPLIGILWWYRDSDLSRTRSVSAYAVGAVGSFIFVWVVVAAIWGVAAVWNGFEASFLVIFDYFFSVRSPPEDPGWWLNDLMNTLSVLHLQVALASAGLVVMFTERVQFSPQGKAHLIEVLLLGLVLAPSVLVKAYNHYFALLALPLGLLVVVFVQSLQSAQQKGSAQHHNG